MESVYICYARSTWSRQYIIRMFNTAFDDDDIVERVDERLMTDATGYEFKIFFVVFSHFNDSLEELVLNNKKGREGIVCDPENGERLEKYFKFTLVQKYKCWNISPANIRIRIEEEMSCIKRIKEADRVMFCEAEYAEDDDHTSLLVSSIRLL